MGAIKLRTSPSEPDVRIYTHPAPRYSGFFTPCSCACTDGMIDVSFQDSWVSNYHDCRQCDANECLRQEGISFHILHKYGFAS